MRSPNIGLLPRLVTAAQQQPFSAFSCQVNSVTGSYIDAQLAQRTADRFPIARKTESQSIYAQKYALASFQILQTVDPFTHGATAVPRDVFRYVHSVA
jgi:hypothetical protein